MKKTITIQGSRVTVEIKSVGESEEPGDRLIMEAIQTLLRSIKPENYHHYGLKRYERFDSDLNLAAREVYEAAFRGGSEERLKKENQEIGSDSRHKVKIYTRERKQGGNAVIYEITNRIGKELGKVGLKYTIKEANEDISYTESGISGKACTYMIRFLSAGEKEVKAMTSIIAKYPEERIPAGYELMNALNTQYRYAKFTLDPKDGGVTAQYDFPVSLTEEHAGPVAVEILIRFMQIIDDVYPRIMKSIWA